MMTLKGLHYRAKRRARWLMTRWPLAEVLNRLPRTCWADLVSWAMHKSTGDKYENAEYSLRNSVGGGSKCQAESAVHRDKTCYCGKFTNGCLTRKGQTPGDVA